MPNPDDTLAAIDDVITWHGSADAMEWTADEPKQPDLLPGLTAIVDAASTPPGPAPKRSERSPSGSPPACRRSRKQSAPSPSR